MNDVQKVLEVAKTRYESKARSKARKWVAIFSKKVKIYGSVLDVFVQQAPEYVSLIWGAFKLLF